jgi:hypothetical protein
MSSRSVFQAFTRLATGPRASKISNTIRRPALWQQPHFNTTIKMSSIGGASIGAGLYAMVSNPAQIAAEPEDAKDKAHHLKNGKGFINPWDSFVETSPFQFMRAIFWLVLTFCISTHKQQSTDLISGAKSPGKAKVPTPHPPRCPSVPQPLILHALLRNSARHGSATHATTWNSPAAYASSSTPSSKTAAHPSTSRACDASHRRPARLKISPLSTS